MPRCSRCGSDGPFYRDGSRASGWARECKKCCQEISKAYRLAHPEWAAKERARRKQWSLDHLERDRARWREKGRARTGQRDRAKQLADPERREKALEKGRAYARKRYRLLAASGNAITPEQWAEILLVWGGACAYCLRTDVELFQDHVIAVSRGGENTPENIVPACNSCNGRKAHHPVFWMAGKVTRLVIPRRAAAGHDELIARLAKWLGEECYRVALRYFAELALQRRDYQKKRADPGWMAKKRARLRRFRARHKDEPEYIAKLREQRKRDWQKHKADPQWLARYHEQLRIHREKKKADPKWIAKNRERRRRDPQQNRERRRREYEKNRANPEWVAEQLARQRAWREKHATDPAYRERKRETDRLWHARKKARLG